YRRENAEHSAGDILDAERPIRLHVDLAVFIRPLPPHRRRHPFERNARRRDEPSDHGPARAAHRQLRRLPALDRHVRLSVPSTRPYGSIAITLPALTSSGDATATPLS